MRFFRFWLILFSISLILVDKYSFISNLRDSIVVFIQKNTALFIYRLQSYPQLLLLQAEQQKQLAQQNVQLKKQVEQYSLLLQQSKNQAQTLQEVTNLNHDQLFDQFQQVISKAILDVNFFVNNQLLIDSGRDKQIAVGNAVVNRNGVIGQISLVNQHNAQLNLLTNTNFKIYVQHAVSKSKMLAQGGGNSTIVVKYIDKSDKIAPGDILETTGLDDIYPASLPVARVIKVFYENNGFNSALCVPVVNFHQLQYVVVLKK